jgi:hypothetical protein
MFNLDIYNYINKKIYIKREKTLNKFLFLLNCINEKKKYFYAGEIPITFFKFLLN